MVCLQHQECVPAGCVKALASKARKWQKKWAQNAQNAEFQKYFSVDIAWYGPFFRVFSPDSPSYRTKIRLVKVQQTPYQSDTLMKAYGLPTWDEIKKDASDDS